MKLVINLKRKAGKFTNMWKLNNVILKNQEIKNEIKKNNLEKKMEHS